jgi:SAM-dependent methyltransferase
MSSDANAEMREFWNGADSREWVDEAERYDGMLAPFADVLLGAADLGHGDQVLDVGCGNGITTLAAARLIGGGAATGVDLSAPMLENARARAAAGGVANATFTVADAQTDPLGGPYDAAISRFGIMFFADSVAAFTNIRAAMAPGARVTFACWRTLFENEWVLVPNGALLQHLPAPELPDSEAPGPFRFGEPGSLAGVLERAGFTGTSSEAVDAPMLVGGPATFDDAFAFMSNNRFARGILGDATGEPRERALAAMREAVEPFATDEGIRMTGSVWIVHATA